MKGQISTARNLSLTTTLSATPAPDRDPNERDPEYLRSHAEWLISALNEEAALAPGEPEGALALDLVVEGYAHVLALDVDRVRLEREIARLAESGDPDAAPQLRELSVSLRRMTRMCKQLRDVLGTVRARASLSS